MDQNRYEKEIEEILKRAGEKPPEESSQKPGNPPRRRSSSAPRRLSLPGIRFNFKTVLLAAIILLIVAVIIETAALYVFLAGVVLLVLGYVMYYRAPRYTGSSDGGSTSPKMWRGRPIDSDNDPHFTDDRWGRGR